MGCSCCDDKSSKTVHLDLFDDNDLVCYCEKVTKAHIIEALKEGAKSVKEVSDMTGACKSAEHCEELNPNKRCCAIDIMHIIDIHKGEKL